MMISLIISFTATHKGKSQFRMSSNADLLVSLKSTSRKDDHDFSVNCVEEFFVLICFEHHELDTWGTLMLSWYLKHLDWYISCTLIRELQHVDYRADGHTNILFKRV